MKILITGCAGLIGANYIRRCLANGHDVIGIDDFSGGYADFLPIDPRFTFYEVNLENQADVSHIFEKHRPEIVFHFAAYAAEGLSPFIRNFNYRNNLLTSINVINECIKHNAKLIFTSSMAVYGNNLAPYTESMIPSPADPYGIAKLAVEMDIVQANEQFGLRYNIVRPHNVLGIYQNIWDNYRNVIGIFIRKTLDDKPMTIYGDGLQTRAFSDVEYCLSAFDRLCTQNDNDVFNIGSDQFCTILDIAALVKKVAKNHGYDGRIEHVEGRHEIKHAYCDHTKAKEVLRFNDSTDVEALIDKMFRWSLTQPAREVKKMSYELTNGIYSYWK